MKITEQHGCTTVDCTGTGVVNRDGTWWCGECASASLDVWDTGEHEIYPLIPHRSAKRSACVNCGRLVLGGTDACDCVEAIEDATEKPRRY